VAAAGAAPLFMLGEAFVAVLVVDFSCFRCGEGVVSVGDLDELFGGGVIATAPQSIHQLQTMKRPKEHVRLLDWDMLLGNWQLTGSYRGGISCSRADMPSLYPDLKLIYRD